jgi:hypothetical protein
MTGRDWHTPAIPLSGGCGRPHAEVPWRRALAIAVVGAISIMAILEIALNALTR